MPFSATFAHHSVEEQSMKSIIRVISMLILPLLVGAQGVDITIVETRADSQNRYVITPVQESVEAWEERYTPDLFAYPVDLVVNIGIEQAALSFADASEVMLLVEYTAEATGGTIVCRSSAGKTLWKKSLAEGSARILLDIPTSESVLSYVSTLQPEAEAVRITRAYIAPMPEYVQRDLGFGASYVCHPNAPCPENEPWRDEVRSSVRIRMALEEGIGWCSGTLLNNTALDGKPYILSAEHCLALNTPFWDLWRFDFNYVSPTCENPPDEPVYNSLRGCSLKSKHRDTDFILLEIDQDVPVAFQPYFSGWNRTPDFTAPKAALIHHPSADITKVSRERNPTSVYGSVLNWTEGYTTPANTHYRTKLDDGAFQPGSSGGALYDLDGYVIGQLHGGNGDCTINTIFSGVFAESWNYGDSTERLRDYLDPIGDVSLTLDGMEHPDANNVYALKCTITDPYGIPVRGVELTLKGAVEMTANVDSTGIINLDLLPRSDSVTYIVKKNINQTNGVSALDLLLIKQHLLGLQPFTEPHQILAADATGNEIASAQDILFLQKLLIGLLQFLPSQDSWIFSPAEITIANPAESNVSIQFTAIKVGDVNGTADPNK